MGHSWISIVALALLGLTCLFAWTRGGPAEKLGAAWVLIINLASDFAISLTFPNPPELILFSLDFMLAAGLLALAIRYSSLWLGMAMLLQAIALCAHAFRLTGEGLHALHWVMLNNLLSQLMLLCIAVATAISWRARHKPTPKPDFTFIGDATAH